MAAHTYSYWKTVMVIYSAVPIESCRKAQIKRRLQKHFRGFSCPTEYCAEHQEVESIWDHQHIVAYLINVLLAQMIKEATKRSEAI